MHPDQQLHGQSKRLKLREKQGVWNAVEGSVDVRIDRVNMCAGIDCPVAEADKLKQVGDG